MICPKCRDPYADKVLDSRASANGQQIRRRRKCGRCGYRWTTLEVLAALLTRKPKNPAPSNY